MTASRTIKFDDHILPAKWYNGFGGAVSRILSAPARAGGENHLSQQPIPGIRCTFAQLGAGRSRIPYLALHRTGFSVPRCLRFARCALTAPFHPYPKGLHPRGGLFSVALSVNPPSSGLPACIRGSSPRLRGVLPCGVRTFLPRSQGPGAILRPAKTRDNIS